MGSDFLDGPHSRNSGETKSQAESECLYTRDSVAVFTRTTNKKKKKNPEEFRKEKSSLMGAEFHRSYFELHQPAGDPGKADFPLPGTL